MTLIKKHLDIKLFNPNKELMKNKRWYISLGIILIATSVILYILQIYFFHKIEDTEFYLLQDLAFVPLQVLLVVLILDRWLRRKEKEDMLSKLNMVIGVFFSEVGTELVSRFIAFEQKPETLTQYMRVEKGWNNKDFSNAQKAIDDFHFDIIVSPADLNELKNFLNSKRTTMLRLLENPNLLEHDTFTDLLWAVFHLTEELIFRPDFNTLPHTDIVHLNGDIVRAFKMLCIEWLSYINHLRNDYPYLFSLALRRNPFNKKASVVVI